MAGQVERFIGSLRVQLQECKRYHKLELGEVPLMGYQEGRSMENLRDIYWESYLVHMMKLI